MGTLIPTRQFPPAALVGNDWNTAAIAAIGPVAVPPAWRAAYAAARMLADQRLRTQWWARLAPSVN